MSQRTPTTCAVWVFQDAPLARGGAAPGIRGQNLEPESRAGIWPESGAGVQDRSSEPESGQDPEPEFRAGVQDRSSEPESGQDPDRAWAERAAASPHPSRLRRGAPERRNLRLTRAEGNPTRDHGTWSRLPAQFPDAAGAIVRLRELSWQSPDAAGSTRSLLKSKSARPLSLRSTICPFSREMQTNL